MAPEVIGRLGYTWSCDWWSLGVVIWELLFHRRPFDGRSAEKMKHSILKDSVRFPSSAKEKCSKEGQQFVLGVSFPLHQLPVMAMSDVSYFLSASRPQPQDPPRLSRRARHRRHLNQKPALCRPSLSRFVICCSTGPLDGIAFCFRHFRIYWDAELRREKKTI